jgi:hypothetical protein
MRWYELAQKLEPQLRKGEIECCIDQVVGHLKNLSNSPFHIVIDLDFTNSIADVSKYLQEFLDKSDGLKAIYTETNGFDINPDQWYFDLFGYNNYGGTEDLEWLSDWQAESEQGALLTGMEELQRVYASKAFSTPEYDEASEFTSLLVVLKFQKLINESAKALSDLNVPILATSHDYDFIYEYAARA